MADINIENFYKHIARILSILYEAFPSKSPLYVDDVAGVDDALDAVAVKQLDNSANVFQIVVRVADNADFHDGWGGSPTESAPT